MLQPVPTDDGDSRADGAEMVGEVDADAVVSYNLRAIRRRRGWTQEQLGERLGALSGHVLKKTSICAMERGYERGRRKCFDVQELYLLAVALDVPMTYFFLPPSYAGPWLANTRRPVGELYAAALGTPAQQAVVGERLGELGEAAAGDVLAVAFGADRGWPAQFEAWRHQRIAEVEATYRQRCGELAAFFAGVADALGRIAPVAYLSGVGTEAAEVGDAATGS